MKTIIVILGLLFTLNAWSDFVPGGNPCMESAGTLLSASGVTSGTTPVQIVAGVAGQQIFVCGLNVQGVSGTNPTFALASGIGTNCGTGTGSLTPQFATVANTLLPFAGPLIRVPMGASLCYSDGGTSPVQNFFMSYIQK